jgi:hypothetical protein
MQVERFSYLEYSFLMGKSAPPLCISFFRVPKPICDSRAVLLLCLYLVFMVVRHIIHPPIEIGGLLPLGSITAKHSEFHWAILIMMP